MLGAASQQEVKILTHCFSKVSKDGKHEIIHKSSGNNNFLQIQWDFEDLTQI